MVSVQCLVFGTGLDQEQVTEACGSVADKFLQANWSLKGLLGNIGEISSLQKVGYRENSLFINLNEI